MKRFHEDSMSDMVQCSDRSLVVDFACFVTCFWYEQKSIAANVLMRLQIPGYELNCISVAVSNNQTIEAYIECIGGLPVTRLLCALKDMGMCSLVIFTFGLNPRTNGAPEAISRIRFRVERCNFVGFYKGTPSVDRSPDFDIRDKCPGWARFSLDQMGPMLTTASCKPLEVVDWCVVACSGDTSALEVKLRSLRIRPGAYGQHYVKGFVCMRTPSSSRIYMEIEPINKTVLLRCLVSELAMPFVEVVTFASNQQAVALYWVYELRGLLIQQGSLSDVLVPASGIAPTVVFTRFTANDLEIWGCVVPEVCSPHWAVQERDNELANLQSELVVVRMENSLLRDESLKHSRLVNALEELKSDRDRLRQELDAKGVGGLIGWSEWELMRGALDDRDKCISQLRARLGGGEVSLDGDYC